MVKKIKKNDYEKADNMAAVLEFSKIRSKDENDDDKTLLDVINEARLKRLLTALKETRLDETLSLQGPFTIFAPEDSAFDHLHKSIKQDFIFDKEKLLECLTFHMVEGVHLSDEFKKYKCYETIEGENVCLENDKEDTYVNNAHIIKRDIVASNGVIHIIDSVLIPEGI